MHLFSIMKKKYKNTLENLRKGHGCSKKGQFIAKNAFKAFTRMAIFNYFCLLSGRGRLKNLDEIVCFKCGENGHFANRCTKGHLAFLSANAGRRHHDQPQQHQNNERNG